MVRLFVYIKRNIPLIWSLFERINGFIFLLIFKRKVQRIMTEVLYENKNNEFEIRQLSKNDLPLLSMLALSQKPSRLLYFQPHLFDQKSLLSVFRNPAFLMMGVFSGTHLEGYFFLRCFLTFKCFVGRLVDEKHEGEGIGKIMNKIMYNIAWRSGFRCLATISKDNNYIMQAHAKNKHMVILKELDDNFLLVEFKPDTTGSVYKEKIKKAD